MEAAAAGTPVVASDVGGTREIFPDDTLARIVPAESPAAIANAMNELLHDPTTRHALAAAVRGRAEQAFDARTSAAMLVDHYRVCLRA